MQLECQFRIPKNQDGANRVPVVKLLQQVPIPLRVAAHSLDGMSSLPGAALCMVTTVGAGTLSADCWQMKPKLPFGGERNSVQVPRLPKFQHAAKRVHLERFHNSRALSDTVQGGIFLEKMTIESIGFGAQQLWNRCRPAQRSDQLGSDDGASGDISRGPHRFLQWVKGAWVEDRGDP